MKNYNKNTRTEAAIGLKARRPPFLFVDKQDAGDTKNNIIKNKFKTEKT